MDINDKSLTDIINEIENIKRRKSVDYKSSDSIVYIDPENNLEKLTVPNNHVIEGRRGSGKTILIIKSITNLINTVPVIYDCQKKRKADHCTIIIDIMQTILSELITNYQDEDYIQLRSNYKKIFGKIKRLFSKSNNDLKTKFKNYNKLLEAINYLHTNLKSINDLPIERKVKYNFSNKVNNEVNYENTSKYTFNTNTSLSSEFEIKYLNFKSKLNNDLELCYNTEVKKKLTKKNTSNFEAAYVEEKVIKKVDLLNECKDLLIHIINQFSNLKNKKISLYLDDFYQITKSNHPYILQYFHDIYKDCFNSSFCFKVCTLPYSLKINHDNEVSFSLKDDFSPIRLDYDLSNLDLLQNHLLNILTVIRPDYNLKINDFKALFSNESLNDAIIATGGIPRDFMVIFAKLIQKARSDNKDTIGKMHIYSCIKELKDDKDNNIEFDSDINPQKIHDAIKIIQQKIVDDLKTNVILYPLSEYEKHENLLKTLINLRYLHLIKDSVNSETKKIDCKALLIDMSFYASGTRKPSDFEFRKFWVKDSSSRLNVLRRSIVWSFDDSFVLG